MPQPQFHFATGMACGLAVALIFPPLRRRWHIFAPALATAGGFWAMVPDLPRLIRALPWFPYQAYLGRHRTSDWLHHELGNYFCFHKWLDFSLEPRYGSFAIVGLSLVLAFYCALIVALIWKIESLKRRHEQRPR